MLTWTGRPLPPFLRAAAMAAPTLCLGVVSSAGFELLFSLALPLPLLGLAAAASFPLSSRIVSMNRSLSSPFGGEVTRDRVACSAAYLPAAKVDNGASSALRKSSTSSGCDAESSRSSEV